MTAFFNEIVNGLRECKEIGKIPVSMGVDTWGVDFVLLDKDDKVLGNTVGYRDHRTEGMDEEVYKTISLKDLYAEPVSESNLQYSISADGSEEETS